MNRFRARRLLLAAALISLPLMTAAATPTAKATAPDLQGRLEALAERARPGVLGVAVLDLQSGRSWRVNADRGFPMMSTFKAALGATVLDRVDHGALSLDRKVTLTRADMRNGPEAIRKEFDAGRTQFDVRRLLDAAVSESDNAAADALIRLLGSPAAVTAFLRAHGVDGMRVDRDEAGLAHDIDGLGANAGAPPGESAEAKLARKRRGFAAYLADPRDTSTPDAAVVFLRKLWRGELLARESTALMLEMMTHSPTVPNRLKGGVPAGARLAHKSGTSDTFEGITAAHNDIGILSWPDGRTVIVAGFLTASPASADERDAIFATLTREVTQTLHP
ncbi:MAG: class A beta-lactamase [Rudaea sp.]|uniref:class A beta-lactamase n=1 Tax=unclassified Rudaea TaxID=2627037 RepID=UPI0010F8D21D|nr:MULTISPECIES: class A beta-lactamase [unclassified Rudaea]MBN8886413.1 class A beta-lactamase [Rudaea sp.]